MIQKNTKQGWLQRGLGLAYGLALPLAVLAVAPTWAQPRAPEGKATSPAEASTLRGPSADIPIERFFQYPSILDAQLSPSGTKLALTTSKGGTRVGLVVLDLADGYKATRAGAFTDADIIEFHWVGEDRLVFSVLDLAAGGGEDRRLAPGLFSAKADGSELRQLVQRRGKAFVTGSSTYDRTLEWNHRLLKVPLAQQGVLPDEVVIGRMNFGVDSLDSITPLWLNVRTGRTRNIEIYGAPNHAVAWLFDSKGEPRVAMSEYKGRAAVHWRGPSDPAWSQLVEGDTFKMPFWPKTVDDAGILFVTSDDGPQGYSVLSRFDFERMQPEKPALVSTPGFDFSGGLLIERAGGRALGVRVDTDGEQTIWFDEGLKRTQTWIDERLPGRINRLSCRRCGTQDMVVLVRSFSDTDPGQLYLYEAASQRLQPISPVMDGIDPGQMAQVDLHRIKARDGRDIPVWLTQPRGLKAGQPLPTVVLVHGGPWIRGGHWAWNPMEQFLASRGYLVISPEFRGSTGYGDAHYKAGWKQWGQAMQDDVVDALQWAQKAGLASQQVCIAGASYGGYSTLMGLIKHPDVYGCGVAWVAVTDPILLLKGSWWVDDDQSATTRSYQLPQLVGDAEKDAAMLTANSPLAQAKRIQAPLLLAFGESDRRVPIAHGERLRAALREAGRPPEWVSYADESHGWRMLGTRVDFARRMERFLAQYLTPGAATAP